MVSGHGHGQWSLLIRLAARRDELALVDSLLLQCVAVANGDGAVGEGLAVDGEAVRRPRLVLPAVAAADRSLFIIEHGHVRLDRAVNPLGDLRHAVLLDERKHSSLDRGDPWIEFHHHAGLHLALFVGGLIFVVCLAKERERAAIGAGRGLDDVRDEPLVRQVVAIRQVLA
jgi:hypothetical protein